MEIIGRLMLNVLISIVVTFTLLGTFAVLVRFEWFQGIAEALFSAAGIM